MGITNPSVPRKLHNGLCEKCAAEHGTPYTFFYGHKVSHSPSTNRVITFFRLKGTASALVGDQCISRHRSRQVLLYIVLALALTAAVGLASFGYTTGRVPAPSIPPATVFLALAIAALFALASIAGVIAELLKEKNERGEELAISIRRSSLEHQGHSFFATQREWDSIKLRERVQGG